MENGIGLRKMTLCESESDLRIISKTPFFSKLYKSFIYDWLMDVIKPHLDPDQFGMKGSSITHCLIKFLHFIHGSLDDNTQTAVIAAFFDMSKAYNRVDHNLLVQDLADMKCPSWLLKIVIAFLSDRFLIFSYKGNITSPRSLPGGAPQGCLLAVIFFIVKFNSALLRPPIPRPLNSSGVKAKYMDDTSAAVSLNLMVCLANDPESRPKPLKYCERTEQILPIHNNYLQSYINEMESFSDLNKMKINFNETKDEIY